MTNLISPNICVEFIAMVFAYFYLRNDKSKPWRLLFPYMVIVVMSEMIGRYISVMTQGNNYWLYNIAMIFEIGMMTIIFDMLFKKYLKSRFIINLGLILLLLMYSFDLFDHGFLFYNKYTRNLFSILMVVYSLIYFYLFLIDEGYVILRNYASFWLVSGILLFHSASTIINLSFMKLDIYIYERYPLRYVVFVLLNLILYTLWSYSFYCRHRQQKI